MSTRSGKRIHSSFHENTIKADAEVDLKSERKTRRKRLKENDIQLDICVAKLKKRHNYVSYPTDDELVADAAVSDVTEEKSTRRVRANTLKDHNAGDPAPNPLNDNKKPIRETRRTKKFAENVEDAPDKAHNGNIEEIVLNGNLKSKKNKKYKHNKVTDEVEPNGDVDIVQVIKKKKKKKGKLSRSSIEATKDAKTSINKSNTSVESFHSAAGSPLHENSIDKNESDIEMPPATTNIKINATVEKTDFLNNQNNLNNTFDKDVKNKRKSSIKNATFDKIDVSLSTSVNRVLNSTFDKVTDSNISEKMNTTFEKDSKTRKSSSSKSSSENTDKLNGNQPTTRKSSTKTKESTELNTTFEKEPRTRRTTSVSDKTDETIETLKGTYEKPNSETKTVSLDSTYDKETNKLNTTFDKIDTNMSNSPKSSLLTSESTINVTFDKSDDSRISITSDESKTENIVNTTPVLIESSMDESQKSLKISNSVDKTNNISKPVTCNIPPLTPLKREGTFTKDGPDVIIMSPRPKLSKDTTPTKRMSLPSPGCTPFHTTRSSQKDRSLLNVTRSIEKPLRRSSLAAVAPRQTRVMFCSPMNNPAVVMQQKRTVIKSSLKGSNKSFVIDDSVSGASRPSARKRSFTQNDAEESRAKRKRLADEIQQSVDRLSRPRTSSATAKLADSIPPKPGTPAKKPVTPSNPKSEAKPSRTKLPNFAALHQKQFAKMESLDEFQDRKTKRARKLLTPTRRLSLDRSTPKGPATEPSKSTKPALQKPETSKTPKLPTLESLRPGYTRFGFKMHLEGGNPFSIAAKTETRPKEFKPNGITRQATLPSLTGTTVDRKEAAKQVVMREKSFTSLSSKRDVKRKENRTIIKGVRTNRRFELQMQLRNIN